MNLLRDFYKLLILCLVMFLGACSIIGGKGPAEKPGNLQADGGITGTLADIQPVALDNLPEETVQVGVQEVINHYYDLLPTVEDPETRARILYRLADLKMLMTDEGLDIPEDVANRQEVAGQSVPHQTKPLTGAPDGPVGVATPVVASASALSEYDLTIETYESLLAAYPDNPENDQVYYQLAKAYDLKGDQESSLARLDQLVARYPHSKHLVEAHFRRGEILYSYGDYVASGKAFNEVVKASGTHDTFYEKALYMSGWSQFKQGDFNQSLLTFTQLLDVLLPRGKVESVMDAQSETLVNDQFRVMGFAFSYLDGAATVKKLFQRVGDKHYEHLVYDSYAKLLISREQELDAIEIYQQFIELHPFSPWSPQYQAKVIDLQLAEGLADEARQEKALYVRHYGINSEYWKRYASRREMSVQKVLKERLNLYLDELAKYHHARAQQLKKSGQEAKPEYALASGYYREFAETFPDSPDTPQMVYLLGESLFEAGDYPGAIRAYEQAAYQYPEYAGNAEAGYAAITTHALFVAGASQEARPILTMEQVSSQLRFVERYPADPRALGVQANAASTLFEQKEYSTAVKEATRITQWEPLPDTAMLLSAWLIISHSEFALERYSQAENGYRESLALMPSKDPQRKDTIELLAASVYKQGEILLAQKQTELAIQEFLRVGAVAPGASVRKNAQYDAATYMLQLEQYDRAIPVLEDFRQRFPQDPLAKDIPAKLALAYRKTERWESAAGELVAISRSHDDPEVRRESLLLAAETYEGHGYVPEAINTYRSYAHTYPKPADLAMEAQFMLTELYQKTGELDKRAFWLAKMESSYQENSGNASDRMRFLAAGASIELADAAYQEFQGVKLKAPLAKNLTRKKKTMEVAMKAYKKAAGYRIAEYTTRSTFQMGEIYAQFSRDLLDSERPANLSDLELEQYELLLEDQAYPFEEDAISIHESNAQRSWSGVYDTWVENSFQALEKLFPVRYQRTEEIPVVSENIL